MLIKTISSCLLSLLTVSSLQKAVKQKKTVTHIDQPCVYSLVVPVLSGLRGRKQSSTLLDNRKGQDTS